jgi:prepilin-type N-terminal cleavage/methylation domain-containing protein
MQRFHCRQGFTLIEIIVVIAIIFIITAFSVTAFRSLYRVSGERVAVQEVADALREAKNKSIASKDDSTYGVHIDTSSVTRFKGDAYVLGHASNTVYTFEAGAFATGTLVETGVDIIFARLTGMPSATGTIYFFDSDSTSSSTVTIGSTGLIEY